MSRKWAKLIFCISTSFYATYLVRSQYAFEAFLDNSSIEFDDFPPEYTKALNHSVEHGQQLTEFNYTSTFKEVKIPRIIHYIWFKNLYPDREGITEMPSQGSISPELCHQHNPTYEIKIWNPSSARDFLATEYDWFLPTYDGYKYPIQRVDALKYFLLLHYGGIYMDLDISCRRPLDPLLEFPAWFPKTLPLGVSNDLMASTPGHPVMERMVKGLVTYNRNFLLPYVTVIWTTGPQFATRILGDLFERKGEWHTMNAGSKNFIEPDAFYILPQIFYTGQYTFFGHSPGSTWHGSDVAVVLWFANRPIITICIVTGALGMVRGITRSRSRRSILSKEKV